MTGVVVLVALFYGLLFGSFINAWAWRLANEESIAKGRSHCTSCGAPIRARDNVPVVSWLLLRGRCRDCSAPISWRYPVGEVITAALYVAVAAYDGLSWVLIPHLIFVSVMVLVSEVDLEVQIIPDVIILPAAAVGLPLMVWLGAGSWWQYPVAGLGAAGFLWLVSELYLRIRHVEGMGFGDVKMALCMGFYLGAAVIPALFMGFVSGAVVGSLGLVIQKKDRQTPIPFGPFLAVGGILALFVGRAIITWYLHLAMPDR